MHRRTPTRRSGIRARTGGAAALLAAALLCLVAPMPGRAAAQGPLRTMSVSVDRFAYVVDAPSDPYDADDTTIHVGEAGGQEYARSFLRLALDYLPDDARVGGASVTLAITQSAEASKNTVYQTYNVNHDAAGVAMKACVLTKELAPPDQFDSTNPPPFDCAKGSSEGKRVTDAAGTLVAWSFDLTPLLKAWSSGNTGAAIVPVLDPSANWTVAFTIGRSDSASVTYRLPPVPPPPAGATKNPGPTYYRIPKAVPPPIAFPTTAPPPAASAAPIPQPTVVEEPSVTVAQSQRAWMWVLPTCLAFAALLLALGHRPAFSLKGGPFRARLRKDVIGHPRTYAVASIVTIWGMLFASYSIAIAPPRLISAGRAGPAQTIPSSLAPTLAGGSPSPGTSLSPGQPGYTIVRRGGSGVTPGSEFTGPGTYRMIGSTRVFFPADGSAPAAQLYTGANDLTGIDFASKTVTLCGHAALTYGAAFDIEESDIRVFWDYLNAHGGIKGWKFNVKTYDDGYDPGKAVQAAERCKADGAFMILGGIGFDQIPAVRAWAESRKQLYVHHIVTTAGSEGRRYSFTSLPSEEQMGEMAGHLAVKKFRGKTIGIIWRQSPNWQSGRDRFVHVVEACRCGMTIKEHPVTLQQSNYTQEISTLKNVEHADVVFAWENALATTEIIQQSQDQDYHPSWIVFPFNLELDTLQNAGFSDWSKMFGVAAWDAYNPGYYEGSFAPYAHRMRQFEEQYRVQNGSAGPNNKLGNDLLFLAWEGYLGVADLFERCLPDCTRNRMAGIMLTYHQQLSGFCDVDFTRRDGHHGGWSANYFDVFLDPRDNHAAWKSTDRCVPVG